MKLGLVILNYKDADRTNSLVKQVVSYESIDRICVVDNASPDDSMQRLQTESGIYEKVSILAADQNSGYAAGNNQGLRYLINDQHCDILMIANPDVSFTEETVMQIRTAFDYHSEYGALGPVMKNVDGTDSARPYIQLSDFWQGVGLCFYCYNRIYERQHPYVLRDDGDGIMSVDALQGSLWAVRAEVLEKAGYLDEGTFLFYEEMSFAMRMRKKCPEYREGLLLHSEYLHNHSASIRSALSELRTYRIYMDSKLYYEEQYHKAMGFKRWVLKMAIAMSILEKRLLLLLTQ